MKAFLVSMVSDAQEGVSATRVLLVLWVTVVTLAWVVAALKTQTLPELPAGVLTFTGTLAAMKLGQRFAEQ